MLSLRQSLPKGTRLVAVSKYHSAEDILTAYRAGQRIFGESHVKELLAKHETLPKDIEWHFIGHLQTNKIAKIAPFVGMIHSVDTFHLLEEISRQGEKFGHRIPCLLQLHVAKEDTKYGFTIAECEDMLREGRWRDLKGVEIAGLMCMATNTCDQEDIRQEFHSAGEAFIRFKERYFPDAPHFCERSWGMSGDFRVALEERSTLVRIGSLIFGERHI